MKDTNGVKETNIYIYVGNVRIIFLASEWKWPSLMFDGSCICLLHTHHRHNTIGTARRRASSCIGSDVSVWHMRAKRIVLCCECVVDIAPVGRLVGSTEQPYARKPMHSKPSRLHADSTWINFITYIHSHSTKINWWNELWNCLKENICWSQLFGAWNVVLGVTGIITFFGQNSK